MLYVWNLIYFKVFLATVVFSYTYFKFSTVSLDIVKNEIYILLLGIVVALVLNSYMPDMKKRIKREKEKYWYTYENSL